MDGKFKFILTQARQGILSDHAKVHDAWREIRSSRQDTIESCAKARVLSMDMPRHESVLHLSVRVFGGLLWSMPSYELGAPQGVNFL